MWFSRNGLNWAISSKIPRKFPLYGDPNFSTLLQNVNSLSLNVRTIATVVDVHVTNTLLLFSFDRLGVNPVTTHCLVSKHRISVILRVFMHVNHN